MTLSSSDKKNADNLKGALKYREKIAKKSNAVLDKLLKFSPTPLQNNQSIQVLIIGAGTFPSYGELLKKLSFIPEIYFTLIEPSKTATDFFETHFAKQKPCGVNNIVHFNIQHTDLKTFLAENTMKFDLVFFEHPETMTFPILLTKIGFRGFARIVSLRESFPLLATALKSNTIIIACCMSRHELQQTKLLIELSLQSRCQLYPRFNPLQLFYSGPYSCGLSTQITQAAYTQPKQLHRVKQIHFSDNLLCGFVLVALVIYCIKAPTQNIYAQIASLCLVGAQLFLHRLGKSGLALKLMLLGALFVI